MPDAYIIGEGRYIQCRNSGLSVAGALLMDLAAVPRNCVWTILSALAYCSVSESQTYWFAVLAEDTNGYPITIPQTAAINPAVSQWYPMLREGMEIKLFPGERLRIYRAAATAGSQIALYARIIESQLPLYEEFEPQLQRKRISEGVPFRFDDRPPTRTLPGRPPGSIPGGGGGGGVPPPPPVY
jgi:hypothetical protein